MWACPLLSSSTNVVCDSRCWTCRRYPYWYYLRRRTYTQNQHKALSPPYPPGQGNKGGVFFSWCHASAEFRAYFRARPPSRTPPVRHPVISPPTRFPLSLSPRSPPFFFPPCRRAHPPRPRPPTFCLHAVASLYNQQMKFVTRFSIAMPLPLSSRRVRTGVPSPRLPPIRLLATTKMGT